MKHDWRIVTVDKQGENVEYCRICGVVRVREIAVVTVQGSGGKTNSRMTKDYLYYYHTGGDHE